MKKVYQLHDSDTEEILGSVLLTNQEDSNLTFDENVNELWEGWEDYNILQEHEKDPCDVNEFVKWFNYHYVTQIEVIDIDFIQL
jgi:hypothetical protein